MVPRYADEPILVLGGKGDVIRKVAEGYVGLQIVLPLLDVLNWHLGKIWLQTRVHTIGCQSLEPGVGLRAAVVHPTLRHI